MAASSVSFPSSTSLCWPAHGAASSYNCRKNGFVTFPPKFSPHGPVLRVARPRYLQRVVRRAGTDSTNHNVTPSAAGFSLPVLPDWAKWVFGALILLAAPGWKKLRDVGILLQQVDSVVETVEVIAEKAEEFAEDLVEDLPDGELKKAVLQVEKASEAVATRAKLIDNILDKLDTAGIGGREKVQYGDSGGRIPHFLISVRSSIRTGVPSDIGSAHATISSVLKFHSYWIFGNYG